MKAYALRPAMLPPAARPGYGEAPSMNWLLGHRHVLHPCCDGVPRIGDGRVVVGRQAEDDLVRLPDEAIRVAQVHVVGGELALEAARVRRDRIGIPRELGECADVVGDLAAQERAGGREDRAILLLEVCRRVVALAGVGDVRQAREPHDRQRHGAHAERVAGQLEQPAIGRELRKLAARMAGHAVLAGLPVEQRDAVGERGQQQRRQGQQAQQSPAGGSRAAAARRDVVHGKSSRLQWPH